MNLNILRKNKNYTQKYVAASLGVSQNTFSQYENKLRQPDIALIPKMAKILDCSIEDIVMCFCEEQEASA